jgi:uncharacterized membrane protein HdeD (DUF308 family)
MAIVSEHGKEELTGHLSEALHTRSSAVLAIGGLLSLLGITAIFSNIAATVVSVYFFGGLMLVAGIAQLVGSFFARRWTGVASHFIIGVLAFVTGISIIRAPIMGAAALSLLMSSWLLASGLTEIAHALMYRMERWGWLVASGTISGLLGLLLLFSWPASSIWVVGLYAGIALVMHGASWLALGATVRREGTNIAHGHL